MSYPSAGGSGWQPEVPEIVRGTCLALLCAMARRRIERWGGIGLGLWVAACGPSNGGSADGGTGGQTDTSTTTNEGDTETPPDTDGEVPETCDGVAVDHATTCADGCPIVADVRVTCDAHAFGDPGLRVAPSPDTTWLVTTSDNHAWMMDLQADGLVAAHVLPEDITRTTMSLALDPAGAPHLAADATQFLGPNDYEGGVVYVSGTAAPYDVELVYDGEVYGPLFDMEVDLDGRAHVWFSSDPPDGRAEAIRELDGSWSQRDAPVPGVSGWQRYTVTPTGASVAFDFVESGGEYHLAALADGQTRTLGGGFGPSYPGSYVHIAPPPQPALDDPGPDYVMLVEHDDGYRVVWPTTEGSQEVALTQTAPFEPTCVVDEGGGGPGSCPTTCEETGMGVEDRMAAIARTSDGRVWVAWMWTERDQTLSYTETCDEEVGCYCNFDIDREESRGEIVVAQVDLDTLVVTEVLRVSDTNPHQWGLFTDYRESPRAFDMRTYGTDLALGARVRNTEAYEPAAIRTLRIDTTLVP